MDDTPTCGRGLAANDQLPEQLGQLATAMAAVLESHLPMLDLADQQSVNEHAVCLELIATIP